MPYPKPHPEGRFGRAATYATLGGIVLWVLFCSLVWVAVASLG